MGVFNECGFSHTFVQAGRTTFWTAVANMQVVQGLSSGREQGKWISYQIFTGHITCKFTSFFAHEYICTWPHTYNHILTVTIITIIYYTIISTQLDIINKQDMFYCFLSLWEVMGAESAVGCWVSRIRNFMSAGTKENTMTSSRRGLVLVHVSCCLAAREPGLRLYQRLFMSTDYTNRCRCPATSWLSGFPQRTCLEWWCVYQSWSYCHSSGPQWAVCPRGQDSPSPGGGYCVRGHKGHVTSGDTTRCCDGHHVTKLSQWGHVTTCILATMCARIMDSFYYTRYNVS